MLVFLPLSGSALQAKCSGLYLIERKVGKCDYLVKTPDCKRKIWLCHVNMLKSYCDRKQTNLPEVKPVGVLSALAPPMVQGLAVDLTKAIN